MVDCGGPNCEACYEEPTEPIDDRIYSWVFLEIEKIGSTLQTPQITVTDFFANRNTRIFINKV